MNIPLNSAAHAVPTTLPAAIAPLSLRQAHIQAESFTTRALTVPNPTGDFSSDFSAADFN